MDDFVYALSFKEAYWANTNSAVKYFDRYTVVGNPYWMAPEMLRGMLIYICWSMCISIQISSLIINCRVVTRVLGVPYSTVVFLQVLLHGTSNPDLFSAQQ